jgi:RNA polymerase subunit RPABC4/transcription elongation factor Spt4
MPYRKCERCNLNYIKEHEVLCKVCLEEVGKAIRNNDEDEEDYDICPECGENIIKSGEDMCYQCMMERMKEEVDEESRKKDEWGDFLPKDEDEELFSDEDDEDLEDLEEIELDEKYDEEEDEPDGETMDNE